MQLKRMGWQWIRSVYNTQCHHVGGTAVAWRLKLTYACKVAFVECVYCRNYTVLYTIFWYWGVPYFFWGGGEYRVLMRQRFRNREGCTAVNGVGINNPSIPWCKYIFGSNTLSSNNHGIRILGFRFPHFHPLHVPGCIQEFAKGGGPSRSLHLPSSSSFLPLKSRTPQTS